VTELDADELLALLAHHRFRIEESRTRMVELVRAGRALGIEYPALAAASGFSRGWIDEIVNQRRKRRGESST
jgi:hypothetical protein